MVPVMVPVNRSKLPRRPMRPGCRGPSPPAVPEPEAGDTAGGSVAKGEFGADFDGAFPTPTPSSAAALTVTGDSPAALSTAVCEQQVAGCDLPAAPPPPVVVVVRLGGLMGAESNEAALTLALEPRRATRGAVSVGWARSGGAEAAPDV